MLLRAGLPIDFWWDAYDTGNYITNRLPTKTAKGYRTPYEGIYNDIPDLSNLKDWREKSTSGYLMGYSTEGEIGYKIYAPELKDTVVGVNCLFNEVIPSYTEEYFNELQKMQFEVVKEPSAVENFQHLVGENYFDDESGLEFQTTRIAIYQGLIVGYRAPVLQGRLGKEEKSPIHVADIVRMCGASTSSPQLGPDHSKTRGILKPTRHFAEKQGGSHTSGRVRFELQESDPAGRDGPRRVAGGHNSPTAISNSGDSTMRPAHDTNSPNKKRCVKDSALQNTLAGSNRSEKGAHTQVHDASLSQDSTTGALPSRTVTRYDATSPEATVDGAVNQMKPKNPERDSTAVGTGIDVFVSHRWDKPNPSKRIKPPVN